MGAALQTSHYSNSSKHPVPPVPEVFKSETWCARSIRILELIQNGQILAGVDCVIIEWVQNQTFGKVEYDPGQGKNIRPEWASRPPKELADSANCLPSYLYKRVSFLTRGVLGVKNTPLGPMYQITMDRWADAPVCRVPKKRSTRKPVARQEEPRQESVVSEDLQEQAMEEAVDHAVMDTVAVQAPPEQRANLKMVAPQTPLVVLTGELSRPVEFASPKSKVVYENLNLPAFQVDKFETDDTVRFAFRLVDPPPEYKPSACTAVQAKCTLSAVVIDPSPFVRATSRAEELDQKLGPIVEEELHKPLDRIRRDQVDVTLGNSTVDKLISRIRKEKRELTSELILLYAADCAKLAAKPRPQVEYQPSPHAAEVDRHAADEDHDPIIRNERCKRCNKPDAYRRSGTRATAADSCTCPRKDLQ